MNIHLNIPLSNNILTYKYPSNTKIDHKNAMQCNTLQRKTTQYNTNEYKQTNMTEKCTARSPNCCVGE
jgi:hypothetical protein